MKKIFETLKKEKEIVLMALSELDTKYIIPGLPRLEKVVIRHFNKPELIPVFVELYTAILDYIREDNILNQYVSMPELIEIGEDYIIRRFYVYITSISNYMDKEDEDYVEPPELFEEMREAISHKLDEASGKEVIIKQILRKSLLEPTGKTICNNRINKFIIVEPKISIKNLLDWQIYKV